MGIAVSAFQPSGDRRNAESQAEGKSRVESGSAEGALSAWSALGAAFCQTGRVVVGGDDGFDGRCRGPKLREPSDGNAGEDGMDGGAPVSVFRAANAPAGVGAVFDSAWPPHHDRWRFPLVRAVPTHH